MKTCFIVNPNPTEKSTVFLISGIMDTEKVQIVTNTTIIAGKLYAGDANEDGTIINNVVAV